MGTIGLASIGTPKTAERYRKELEPLVGTLDFVEVPREAAGSGDTEQAIRATRDAIGRLAEAGCDTAVLAGVGAQRLVPALGETDLPILSMGEAIRDKVREAGYSAVFVLGGYPAMKEPFLKRPLILSHIAVITPSEEEKRWLAQALADARGQGITDEDRARIEEIFAHGAEEGAQALVSADPALTEIAESACGYPVFDAIGCHIEAAAGAAGAR